MTSKLFLNPGQPDASGRGRLGGKGAALARLGAAGFPVPPWFAVGNTGTVDAGELSAAMATLGPGPFAVRSSAMAEDGAGHSFAGQFESHLRIPAANVAEAVASVRASAQGAGVLAYCQRHGLPAPEAPVALVQQMVDARCAGVAFSADPVTGRRSVAVVTATEGTAERLVAGETEGETWRFSRGGTALETPPGGILSEPQARGVALLARRCEAFSQVPQDIEWALDRNGKLWLLQSRPITTLGSLPDPDDTLRVWDNSNIAESYGGVTTPMTFSFARRVYESVYREFCRMMGVPAARMEAAEEVFPHMLGLVRGRVYYNLRSWHVVLATLPGFRLNRRFMEQMMGVREPLPEEMVEEILSRTRGSRAGDLVALARTCAGLAWRLLRLEKQIGGFRRRLETALAPPPAPLAEMRGDELVKHYMELESALLKRWDAPLTNDFFAMLFHGLLRALCARWLGDSDGTLQNELLLDCGDIISAEPPRRIMAMARMAAAKPGLARLLADPGAAVAGKLAALRAEKQLAAEYDRYLADFSDRCLEELKLESPTLEDDPGSLLTSIGAMARRFESVEAGESGAAALPPAAAPSAPRGLKGVVFRRILRQARARVAARENLRFERTRLFGRVRAIIRELGRRLCADGVLDEPEDVFYLELSELLSHWDGTGSSMRPGGLARARRAEFDAWRAGPPPPDRFATHGPPARSHFCESAPAAESAAAADTLKGSGACPGVVRGPVRVVLDPRGARLEPGEILVARQTDPGWVVLFPAAAGLLVERGSLLSHSAIVAREMRLPCVVGLAGISRRLRTGMTVEMDGATGAVRVLENEGGKDG